jgi:hypothetical protein
VLSCFFAPSSALSLRIEFRINLVQSENCFKADSRTYIVVKPICVHKKGSKEIEGESDFSPHNETG